MTLTQIPIVKTLVSHVRATLITGHDDRGNEYFYFQSIAGWQDGYNECPADPDYVRRHVYPNVMQVRFPLSGGLSHTMTRNEWIEAGCPLDLTKEQVESLIAAPHPVDEVQRIERKIDAELRDMAEWQDEWQETYRDLRAGL